MQANTQTKHGELPNGQLTASNDPRRHVRSQTPQESLGLSGKSGLFKASLQASVLFAIVFGVLTFIPFMLEGAKKNTATATPVVPPADKTDEASPNTAPQPTPKPEGTPKTPTNPKISPKDDYLIKSGESGTKTGSPKTKDPFKTNDDDLLK
ncbi:MAG: hypothetical protein K8U57_37375 [Planctomycetes bacterium]|nr:hypothetical protein [Planctomycetota bacterium]